MIYKGINFNGSSYTSGDCKLWCNFDNSTGANLFLAERHVVCLEYAGGDDPYIGPDSDTRIATYARDENDRVIIDLTDWLRTHYKDGTMSEQEISVFCPLNDDIFDLFYGVGSIFLINPNKMVMPIAAPYGALILPPSRIIYGRYQPCAYTLFWKADAYSSISWRWRKFGTSLWTNLSMVEELTIDPEGIEIIGGNATIYTYIPEQEVCEKRCAYLIWKSFAGPEKMHAFDINSQKLESVDTYSLLTPDGSYSNIKGTEDSMRLSIDKLTTYDLWYYSDILTSSDVRLVIYDEEFVGSISSGRIVGGIPLEIITKSSIIQSGDRADGKIEFEAKIKRYDAVAL